MRDGAWGGAARVAGSWRLLSPRRKKGVRGGGGRFFGYFQIRAGSGGRPAPRPRRPPPRPGTTPVCPVATPACPGPTPARPVATPVCLVATPACPVATSACPGATPCARAPRPRAGGIFSWPMRESSVAGTYPCLVTHASCLPGTQNPALSTQDLPSSPSELRAPVSCLMVPDERHAALRPHACGATRFVRGDVR